MSADDLETYEAELRMQLYREYRDVSRMFRYVVETERGVYLANGVARETVETGGRPRIVLDLTDAWVWDMYRSHRFVPHVQITTFRDVVIEELAHEDLDVEKRLALADEHGGRPPDPSSSHPSTLPPARPEVPGSDVPGSDGARSDVAGSDVARSDVAGSDVAGSDGAGSDGAKPDAARPENAHGDATDARPPDDGSAGGIAPDGNGR